MNLPLTELLPIEYLASSFNKVTNSYKFYWFLAILECLKNSKSNFIPIDNILFEMIAEVWYPINYFKLSFGKQDQFSKTVALIKNELKIGKEIKKKNLIDIIKKNKHNNLLNSLISDLSRYVPFRFLSPWFSRELTGIRDVQKNFKIFSYANRSFTNSLKKPIYKFSNDKKQIIISEEWMYYLMKHIKIIRGFTYWHLLDYLQKNNPNVPNIQKKLFPPLIRNLSKARSYWTTYIQNVKDLTCIFSQQPLEKSNITIDHYLPWSFVAHDQLWNLLPTTKSVNSAKSDIIPSNNYLGNFANLQYSAFHCSIKSNKMQPRVLEDYSILFNDTLMNIASLNKAKFEKLISDNLKPLIQIAFNMGFSGNWIYKK